VKDRARGVDGVKNRSEKCEGPRRGGGTNDCLKRKVFFKNQKHQPNIVEITHLCIMHGVHTSTFCNVTMMKINTQNLLTRIQLYSFQYFIYLVIITNFLINFEV
jgi:hypothetical protein